MRVGKGRRRLSSWRNKNTAESLTCGRKSYLRCSWKKLATGVGVTEELV